METKLTAVPIRRKITPPAPFQIATRTVPNSHLVKVTFDCGRSPGPWAIIGINDKAYCAGYLPKSRRHK